METLTIIIIVVLILCCCCGGAYGYVKYVKKPSSAAAAATTFTVSNAQTSSVPSSLVSSTTATLPTTGGFTTVAPAPSAIQWMTVPQLGNFLPGAKYQGVDSYSDTGYLDTAKAKCAADPACYGFFEQTQQCPEPANNDKVSNPVITPDKGCHRLVGYFNTDDPLTAKPWKSGGTGSVLFKTKDDARRAAITAWAAPITQ